MAKAANTGQNVGHQYDNQLHYLISIPHLKILTPMYSSKTMTKKNMNLEPDNTIRLFLPSLAIKVSLIDYAKK
mgnify:CR=1 FL=1